MRRSPLFLGALFAAIGVFVCPGRDAVNGSPQERAKTARTAEDTLGLACPEILVMTSSDWVARFTSAKGTEQQTIHAIEAYGKCYDARTDRIATSLVKTGKGPQATARANFRDFDQSLKDFTAKALAATQSFADPSKAAYAALYEKQFRYQFYETFIEKPASGDATKAATPAPKQDEVADGAAKTLGATLAPSGKDASDADPVTQAKNHFGELIGDLPDTTMHQLHAAFGEILGSYATTPAIQLRVYRYAIFLLEPPGSQPFSPPPF